MTSNLLSQASTEQDELIKYEYNLASCYETEYLLSLKLQEDMIHSLESCTSYDDGYEVQMDHRDCPEAQLTCIGSPTSSIEYPRQDSLISHQDEEAMETTSSVHSHHRLPQPTFTSDSTDHQHISASQPSHPTTTGQSPFTAFPIKNTTPVPEVCSSVQNGSSLMWDLGHGNAHNEGPSRKKICLHQPNY